MTEPVITDRQQEMAERLLRSVGDVALPDAAAVDRDHPLAAAAQAAALSSAIGRIVLAGVYSTGDTWVQFNADGGSGYASAWPAWAFGIAKDALLSGKKVWVLSNGDPFGSNLVTVLLYAP
jgi:hypothetical protein